MKKSGALKLTTLSRAFFVVVGNDVTTRLPADPIAAGCVASSAWWREFGREPASGCFPGSARLFVSQGPHCVGACDEEKRAWLCARVTIK